MFFRRLSGSCLLIICLLFKFHSGFFKPFRNLETESNCLGGSFFCFLSVRFDCRRYKLFSYFFFVFVEQKSLVFFLMGLLFRPVWFHLASDLGSLVLSGGQGSTDFHLQLKFLRNDLHS